MAVEGVAEGEREAVERAALLCKTDLLSEMIGSGKVRIDVRHRWPLAEAGEAHRALEGRKTTGSVVLLP